MSGTWGRTGRVKLDGDATRAGADVHVLVDGARAGWVGVPDPRDPSWWAAVYEWRPAINGLPSRDAAVMWILRRAAPKVWAAERPVVYRVWRDASADAWWLAAAPVGGVSWAYTWRSAMASAERRARAEYGRAAA